MKMEPILQKYQNCMADGKTYEDVIKHPQIISEWI